MIIVTATVALQLEHQLWLKQAQRVNQQHAAQPLRPAHRVDHKRSRQVLRLPPVVEKLDGFEVQSGVISGRELAEEAAAEVRLFSVREGRPCRKIFEIFVVITSER